MRPSSRFLMKLLRFVPVQATNAIAYFYYRDHVILFGDELKPEDHSKLFSKKRPIRTETSVAAPAIGRLRQGPQ